MHAAVVQSECQRRAEDLISLKCAGAADADFAAAVQEKKGMPGMQRDVAAARRRRWTRRHFMIPDGVCVATSRSSPSIR